MAILIGSDRVLLSKVIGQGGAATVYEHPLYKDQCVKIHNDADKVEAERIRFQIANPPPQLVVRGIPLYAWPRAAAYEEQSGALVGFSMARLHKVLPVQAIIDPSSCGSAITRRWRWKVAINIAELVHTLHLMHPPHIMGDVNLENFLVHRDARVTAIDMDSTHFTIPGIKTFLCDRHRPEMQPPELVSATAPVIERDQDQDAFSVFILVHRLIREGIHPFDAIYTGSSSPLRLYERIEQGIWPDSGLHADYRSKAGTIPFTSLPTDIQDLNRRMFLDGITDRSKRPNVTELLTALQLHQPLRSRYARISRRAWRREIHPNPKPFTRFHRSAEFCRAHIHKAGLLALLGVAIATRSLPSDDHEGLNRPTKPQLRHPDALPKSVAPVIKPPTTYNQVLPEPPRPSQFTRPLIETPRLWRLAEDGSE